MAPTNATVVNEDDDYVYVSAKTTALVIGVFFAACIGLFVGAFLFQYTYRSVTGGLEPEEKWVVFIVVLYSTYIVSH